MAHQILFLYLNTGNGHIAPARHMKKAIEQRFSDNKTAIYLEHGFSPKSRIDQIFYEKGYHLASVFIPAAYSLFYEMTRPSLCIKALAFFLARKNFKYIKKLILEKNITKIVCFHFAVTPAILRALDHLRLSIPVVVTVTDPFTAHPAWFLHHDRVEYVVFSDKMEKQARMVYGIHGVHNFPFILPPEMNSNSAITTEKTSKSDLLHSYSNKPFSVLIAGGGEGLSNVIKIILYGVRKFIKNDNKSKTKNMSSMEFTIVCGRNAVQKFVLEKLVKQCPQLPLTIYGFVNNMPELLSKADCVISKAGASTVFEVLAMKKPLIITHYIHGQELGNVQFVIQNGCGWFIRKSASIYKKILQLQNNPEYYAKIVQNAEKLDIHSQLDELADFIYKE